MEERLYWLGFSIFSGIGPATFGKLLTHFQTAEAAWIASEKELREVLQEKLTADFLSFRETFSFEEYTKKLEKKQVAFLTLNDSLYPELLKQIPRPPFVLYVKGNVDVISSGTRDPIVSNAKAEISHSVRNDLTIAVVGARKITSYGKDVTKLFVQELVLSGRVIVSGLAMGVDAVAHQTTLDNHGKTIAVLGCGVDCCSPGENQYLYDQIINNKGCILSELALGHSPTKGSFPARNRIIAGLSQAVLVTEGAEDSGSLITADYAFKFNRPVFAVPGPITSQMSKGPYKLISKGAKLVTKGEDIMRELGISSIKGTTGITGRKRGETEEEEKILQLLENEPLHFDELVRQSVLPSAAVASIVSLLEIKGHIKNTDSGQYSLET